MAHKTLMKEETKTRILHTALRIFAQKGFDATSVSEIAASADVNKALIYYYFSSKEDILDTLIQKVSLQMEELSLDFIRMHIVSMIEQKRLDILQDRFRFSSREDLNFFIEKSIEYYRRLIGFAEKRKDFFKILLSESLKETKHSHALFDLFEVSKTPWTNRAYHEIKDADEDFCFTDEFLIFRFFFTMLPIVELSIYGQQLSKAMGKTHAQLSELFLYLIRRLIESVVKGNDIFLKMPQDSTQDRL